MMRVLFLGDVVGSPGRAAVIGQLAEIKKSEEVDFIIINGENAAGGRGITPKISIDLLRAGAAVVTLDANHNVTKLSVSTSKVPGKQTVPRMFCTWGFELRS